MAIVPRLSPPCTLYSWPTEANFVRDTCLSMSDAEGCRAFLRNIRFPFSGKKKAFHGAGNVFLGATRREKANLFVLNTEKHDTIGTKKCHTR